MGGVGDADRNEQFVPLDEGYERVVGDGHGERAALERSMVRPLMGALTWPCPPFE